MSLKEKLINELKLNGAFEVRIADPLKEIEHADPKRSPVNIWPSCKSLIMFITPRAPDSNNTYVSTYSPCDSPRQINPLPKYFDSPTHAVYRLSTIISSLVELSCARFLIKEGYNVFFDKETIQKKLYANESGLGVYGRSGVILNPVLGNRICIGAILTDAVLEPDQPLKDYKPCEKCRICVNSCPAKAYGESESYHSNWDVKKCMAARKEIESRGLYCHNCFAKCIAGKMKDSELFSILKADNNFG